MTCIILEVLEKFFLIADKLKFGDFLRVAVKLQLS
jgi:hypothetical protein